MPAFYSFQGLHDEQLTGTNGFMFNNLRVSIYGRSGSRARLHFSTTDSIIILFFLTNHQKMIPFAEEDNDLDLPDHSGTSIRLVHKHLDPRIVSVYARPPSSSSPVVCNCKYLSNKSSAILDSNENLPRCFNFVFVGNRRCCKHSGTNFLSFRAYLCLLT